LGAIAGLHLQCRPPDALSEGDVTWLVADHESGGWVKLEVVRGYVYQAGRRLSTLTVRLQSMRTDIATIEVQPLRRQELIQSLMNEIEHAQSSRPRPMPD